MIKRIARLAVAAAAAGALALGAAGTAGAAFHPAASPVDGCSAVHPGFCGTWGTEDGTAFLAAVGPAATPHPASSSFTQFNHRPGVSAGTSWFMFHPAQFSADNGAVAQFSDAHFAEAQSLFLNADVAGNVTFIHVQTANTEWIFVDSGDGVNGQFVNGATGQALCLGAHGAISTIPAGGSQSCALLHFVPAS